MSQMPMTAEEFFAIFRTYNSAVWPAPVLLFSLAVLAMYRASRAAGSSDRIVAIILALFWAWSGIAYHLVHHAPHNPAAFVFGILFVVQATVFLWLGAVRHDLCFGPRTDRYGIAGAAVMTYALVVYPLIGHTLGHRFPATPTFGAPCPITIFTFGLLLWTAGRVRWYVLAIPFVWAVVAVGAAVSWGVLEDLAMPAAAIAATVLLLSRNRAASKSVAEARPALVSRG